MSKKHDAGKWAEKQAQDWLDAMSNANIGFAYHRYPDARAARGALAAQPSDYLVADRGLPSQARRVIHLEVKETAQERRLPKAKISQYGMLKKFDYAGIEPVVLVFRSAFKDWVILTADHLFAFDVCPPSFLLTGLAAYPTAAAALKEIFK